MRFNSSLTLLARGPILEFDVYERQILTSKVGLCTERIKKIMTVDS